MPRLLRGAAFSISVVRGIGFSFPHPEEPLKTAHHPEISEGSKERETSKAPALALRHGASHLLRMRGTTSVRLI
jgi:hypothetical protein